MSGDELRRLQHAFRTTDDRRLRDRAQIVLLAHRTSRSPRISRSALAVSNVRGVHLVDACVVEQADDREIKRDDLRSGTPHTGKIRVWCRSPR
jgi:hypothetical protein